MAHRRVHRPPYPGVEGLIQWALDMWPVVNGRCLVSGIDLKTLDAASCLDALYYIFEQDAIDHPDVLTARSHTRVQIWPLWFGHQYKYPRKEENAQNTFGSQDMMDLPDEVRTQDTETIKPFVPASTPEELAKVLDGPLGGD